MFEQRESRRKQGPGTVLTLLFGLLLAIPGSPNLGSGPNAARLASNQSVRAAATLRAAPRSEEHRSDERGPARLPAPPRIVTELVSARPEALGLAGVAVAAPAEAVFHYRARAPPAA